ncbi:MAG: VTT domain-containing protein [Candidatus Woesearchaeota archaeon]
MHRALHRIYGFHLYAMGKIRSLYDWVISWGHTKYGVPALCVLAFAESSFFPVPPDVLLICLGISRPKRALWYAFLCTLFSVIGGLFGYLIGFAFYAAIGKPLIALLGYQSEFEVVGRLFQENAFWAMLTAALTPIPYKVFTIAAGFWKIMIPAFVVGSIVGRGARFFAISALLFFFGERVKVFIDRYFNLLTFVALGLLIGGFLIIKYVL